MARHLDRERDASHGGLVSFLPAGTWVIEHKTTAEDCRPGSTYWKRLVLDSQCSNYDDGVRSRGDAVIKKPSTKPAKATPLESRDYIKEKSRACKACGKKNPPPGPHIETVKNDDGSTREVECVNGRIVTDPGGRLHANMRDRDETPEEYFWRLIADIAADPEKYYQRGEVVRLDDERNENAADVWAVGEQIRASEKMGRWPRNVDACDQYGSFCTYWPVCSGETTIDDPAYYRDAEEHEELSEAKTSLVDIVMGNAPAKTKRKLPLLTTSSAKKYRSCQRRYFFSQILKRKSAYESDVLRFGTLVHKGLEVWWRTCNLDAALDAMAGESDPFDLARAEALLIGYHFRWFAEPFEVLAVEKEFVSPLVNPDTGRASRTWMRGGKIDALARVA
jgi:hypothetical protein